ncbi:MAG: cytochrome d ubiquinol oxidase subunit II [Candidatus Micrarchaeota archaeon]|nr:cytochrome d ubiquinol oxidase subunit II [Candidatus Micrarchaeota archaeon]MDE1834016.1 cytochrome d ubiquinol oxidase subunit II [Candidatus Micrarchaeota archaeon]MDE1859475.1 cytochrome d ubiquinol oxidase subunit II [Candidatus Micrarchaeota archaeon]
MNLLVDINIVVFALVFSLFAVETGIALLNLLAYEKVWKRTTQYIAASWAISGTFLVFYIVNFEATYPLILTQAGTLYIVPVLLAGLFVIFRNAFIAYSEYAEDAVAKKTFVRVYAISTLIAVFLLISVLSSTVTGTGVNLSTMSLDYLEILFNPYNLLMFVCTAAVSILAVIMLLSIEKPLGFDKVTALSLLLVIIIATFLYATLTYAPFVAQGLGSRWLYLIPGVVMLLVAAGLYLNRKGRWNAICAFLWLVTTVSGFETLGHPKIFGGALSISSFLAPQSAASASLIITVCTAMLLAVGAGLLIYANRKSSKKVARY